MGTIDKLVFISFTNILQCEWLKPPSTGIQSKIPKTNTLAVYSMTFIWLVNYAQWFIWLFLLRGARPREWTSFCPVIKWTRRPISACGLLKVIMWTYIYACGLHEVTMWTYFYECGLHKVIMWTVDVFLRMWNTKRCIG